MCGIAGWIGPYGTEVQLKAMTDAVAHRGPDGEGQEILPLANGAVAALGHRRLSIIDLATGGQPMASHDNRFTLVFNGEIYNYIEIREELLAGGARFQTKSDTEVILEAWRVWGPDSLTRFRGMFGFAIYDAETRQVTIARDNFGKKPIYIAETQVEGQPCLVFGSEIQSLLQHPAIEPKLDEAALRAYLGWRYVPAPKTLFQGIEKLTPGSYLTWNAEGEVTRARFWLPPEEREEPRTPPEDPVAEFLEVFDRAVTLRLRADVPLGAFLSGGLDSTAIVASIAHHGISGIRTFSVGFKDDPASELPLAEATAREIGTIHTPVVLEPGDLTDDLPILSRHRAAPIAEPADLPIYRMSIEAAKQVKVVLSGEGSDELFGGYPKHWMEARMGGLAPSGLLSLLGHGAMAATSLAPAKARRVRIAAQALRERRFEDRMVSWFAAFPPDRAEALWKGPPVKPCHGPIPFNAAPGASPLRQVLHFDQTSWLPDNLLERMDIMTMAASIEGRAPFMDIRLAEYAARLSDDWRIRGKVGKYIVRQALEHRIPKIVIDRPKNGFRLPVAEWFRGPLADPFRDLVTGPGSISAQYFDTKAIGELHDAHKSGAATHDKALWSLFALETFLREFF
ncbi:MAG: asparagine synthase (glutamine-hydrolyzing) [Roseibium sp.]|uniref:asparagine synthase (glutamine-hydrolyzing) n=1 Tax=Roseibium sp. TaxID=1936156 RepID=UPI003D9C1E57